MILLLFKVFNPVKRFKSFSNTQNFQFAEEKMTFRPNINKLKNFYYIQLLMWQIEIVATSLKLMNVKRNDVAENRKFQNASNSFASS